MGEIRHHNFGLYLTAVQAAGSASFMKTIEVKPTIRIVAAILVTAAVVGVSGLGMQASTQNHSLAPSLKSIQTDKATSFYAGRQAPSRTWFVEQVLPGTGESKAATENLKVITAAL